MSKEDGESNVFNLDDSLQADLDITIQVSDQSQLGNSYNITVLAQAPNNQCATKQFTVSLIDEYIWTPFIEEQDELEIATEVENKAFAKSDIESTNILKTWIIISTEQLSRQLPSPIAKEIVDFQVDLGDAAVWLKYDETTKTIEKKDDSTAIPVAEYTVIIRIAFIVGDKTND